MSIFLTKEDNTIAEQKFDLTLDQAKMIFKGPLKEYVREHNGNLPDINNPDPKVREMAAALQMLRNLKARQMSGLEYEE